MRTPVDKLILYYTILACHGSRLDRLTCHAFTARCKGASPTIQSTTKLFLQHVTRQAKAWPLAPSSNTSFFNCNLLSGSLNTTCVGPESRLPAQKLAETQALAQQFSFPPAFQETVRFHFDPIPDLPVNSKLLGFIGLVTESAKVSDLSATPPSASQDFRCRDKCRWPIACADSASFLHFLTSEDSEPFVGLS